MERIFKIKTKSDRDPRNQYPSERRYSASIVIGLSVVYFQLFIYSILMGILIIYKLTLYNKMYSVNNTDNLNITNEILNSDESMCRLYEKIERDFGQQKFPYYINIPALVCGGCFIMAFGYVLCIFTGILAWKRWYIDQNITFFFLSSCFSTITSSISLLLSLLTSLNMNVDLENYKCPSDTYLPLTFSLTLNITILSTVGMIWSFLSTRVSYRGMKNSYPDDMVIAKGGRHIEVNTVKKGNKNTNMFPPDIISHFPANDKLAKYLPKQENNSNLPKAESNYEYQQRVNKFLSGDPDNLEK